MNGLKYFLENAYIYLPSVIAIIGVIYYAIIKVLTHLNIIKNGKDTFYLQLQQKVMDLCTKIESSALSGADKKAEVLKVLKEFVEYKKASGVIYEPICSLLIDAFVKCANAVGNGKKGLVE